MANRQRLVDTNNKQDWTSSLTKIVPFTAPFAWSGAKGRDMASYKYLKLQDKAVTAKEYQKAQEKWNKERAESNKKHKKSQKTRE